MEKIFNKLQMKVIQYCAEEVRRQCDIPDAVWWMLDAWNYASAYRGKLTNDFIEEIGRRVEPKENAHGFRTIPIYVGNHTGSPVSEIRARLVRIIEGEKDPKLFYKEFELIHPFVDGNGRSGKIIMNWMSGDLYDPVMPPDFFGCSNP